MLNEKQTKNTNQSIENFLEYRKGLSDSDNNIEAGLLVEEIQSVNVDEAYNEVSSRINRRFSLNRTITIITRIAAVFTIPLLAFTIWSLMVNSNMSGLAENKTTWHEIQSPVGMRSHIVLPDGTDLWLNAGSKIKYAIPFIKESRKIDLSGEAFLHVVKNEKSPFLVNAGNTEVKVLGTQFNIKSYPEDKHIEVALEEGSIEFSFTRNNGQKASTKLKPNDYLILNKKSTRATIENKNIEKYISWRQNIMILDETPMLEVAKILERWYGVKVVITDNEIKKYKFTTTFENETLHRVLELLEISSPISIKYTLGKINKKSKIPSPSIVTISKK
jgi:ferric-dicitrate binding protein FerR (iron transport regulator)